MIPAAIPEAADTPTVAADIFCITCGYDLRSLPRTGLCPECGTAVAESLLHHEMGRTTGGVPLAQSDRRWLRALRGATLLLLAAAAWQVVLYSLPLWQGDLPPSPVIVRLSLFFLPEVMVYWGVWRLSRAEPTSPRLAAGRRNLRLAIRLGVIGSLATLAYMFVMYLTNPPAVLGKVMPDLAKALFDAAVTSLVLVYLSRLARRGQRPGLARAALLTAWVSPVMLLPVIPQPTFRYLFLIGAYYGMSPAPVLGYVEATAPVLARLYRQEWGTDLIPWSALAAYGLVTTFLVYRFSRMFKKTLAGRTGGGTAERIESSSAP
jgi:hypothetical protein